MGDRSRGPLRSPSWLVGPGLVVPPFFIAMFAAVAARPVAPTLAEPRLDRAEADRQVRSLLARRDAALDPGEEALLRAWETYGRLRVVNERTGRQLEAVSVAGRGLARECRAVVDDRGVDRALAVGDVAAGRLVAALIALGAGERGAEQRVEGAAGTFLSGARRIGLVDRRGRLRAHPLVAAAAVKAGFRAECGLPTETGLSPVELAALDVLTIRFTTAAPPRVRARAAERFGEHAPGYPSARAMAAILLAEGEPAAALEVLEDAARRAPSDRSLRNNVLFVLRELGGER